MTRCIYTVCAGNVAYSRLTLPYMRAYARRVGADFRIIGAGLWKDHYPEENGNKIYQYLLFEAMVDSLKRGYQRFLYLDLDILVLGHAPNIFSKFTKSGFHVKAETGEIIHRFNIWAQRRYGRSGYRRYFNSGVILGDRESLRSFVETLRHDSNNFAPHCLKEQNEFCRILQDCGAKIHSLSEQWNCIRCAHKNKLFVNPNVRGKAYLVHFAGFGQKRDRALKDFVRRYEKRQNRCRERRQAPGSF